MLDLGTSFIASVARDPDALAIVDGELRLSYADWFTRVSAVVSGLDGLGLKPGDHLISLLQNRWEAATLHWACQLSGLIITPLNWRATAEDLDFCLADADAAALVFEDAAAATVAGAGRAAGLPQVRVGGAADGATCFAALLGSGGPEAIPRADANS